MGAVAWAMRQRSVSHPRSSNCRDVEAATLARDGSPPITRITFPTCRAHYPGGSSGCSCRLLPRSRGLPQLAGGSASALSLSRPAQTSLTLRPAGSARLRGALPGADIANFVVNLGERRCLRHLQPFELARHRALRAVLASTGSSKGGNCGLALIIVFRHGIPTAPGSTHPVRRSQRRALLSGLWPLLRNQAGQHPVHD